MEISELLFQSASSTNANDGKNDGAVCLTSFFLFFFL